MVVQGCIKVGTNEFNVFGNVKSDSIPDSPTLLETGLPTNFAGLLFPNLNRVNVYGDVYYFTSIHAFRHRHMKACRKVVILVPQSTGGVHIAPVVQVRVLRLVSRGSLRRCLGRGEWRVRDSRGAQHQARCSRNSSHCAAGAKKHHKRYLIVERDNIKPWWETIPQLL